MSSKRRFFGCSAGKGRPLREPGAGPARYHLGLRYTDAARDQLLAVQDIYNSKLNELGLLPNVTVSSMVKRWIDERLKAEVEKWKLLEGQDK